MSWYTAHIIMYVKFKDGQQNSYPFWENIILIEAADEEEAFAKAEQRALQDEGDSGGTFTHHGRPATSVFGGIRRLVHCVGPDEQPSHGMELSCSELEVSTKAEFEKVIQGKSVTVWYGGDDNQTGKKMPDDKLKPIHPGEILLEKFLKPMGLSQKEVSLKIGVPLSQLYEIVSGERGITADTALRLGRYFDVSPQFWLELQMDYDLDVAVDKLANRLNQEVQPYAMGK